MPVKGGSSHIHLPGQFINLKRLFVIISQPGDALGYLVTLCTERVDHSQAFALRSNEQTIMDLTDNHRCENRYLFRLLEKLNQAQEGIQHVGINTFIGVLEEREQKGINDELGKEPSPMPANKSSIELGTEIQTRLVGAPATGKYISFAPAIDQFLKGHLFGDIFGRDNLDFQSREIATISALANMEGVNPQLQSHFSIGFNVGLVEAQMRSLISILEAKVGKKEADNANEILGKVLENRAK